MATVKEFERGLDHLFRQYTEGLRRAAGKQARGPVPKLTRDRLKRRIERLVQIAVEIELSQNGRPTFDHTWTIKKQWHVKRGKGWGVDAKKRSFKPWYDAVVGVRSCVYVFWAKRRCMYVGRTGSGGRRPIAHFEKHWFAKVTRVDVYLVDGKRRLPMSECLAIHIFRPKQNKIKSAQQKWRSTCPVCFSEVQTRSKLKALFPLKRPRRQR